jgi:hypothetical protein
VRYEVVNILFVDDTRTFPDRPEDCVVTVRTSAEAIVELEGDPRSGTSPVYQEIWLDFDLGGAYGQNDLYDTAMPVALWLAEQAFYGVPYGVKRIMIHTGNPIGRLAMGLLLRRLGYDVADVGPLGAEQLSAAAQEATATDDAAKAAERFVWKPGDITITNPDGTVGSS